MILRRLDFKYCFVFFRFIPIDKTVYKKPYLPMMNTTAKYGALDYGTKAFRDEKKHEELHGGVSYFLN